MRFSSGKPLATSAARPLAKNPQRLQPLGFFSSGLASDVALGLLLENPSGGLQSTPRAKIEFSRDRPRAKIHLATPSACPHIVPGVTSYKMCQIIHQQNLDGVLCNITLESRKEGDIWMDFTQMMEECQYKDLL